MEIRVQKLEIDLIIAVTGLKNLKSSNSNIVPPPTIFKCLFYNVLPSPDL